MLSFFIHDSLTRFIAQVVVIVVVSRGIALVTRRLAQPLVIMALVTTCAAAPLLRIGALRVLVPSRESRLPS
jgi:Kef-type K+ transport system membrane component KefB